MFFYNNNKSGFALAEIVVALFFVTLVTVLVADLADQAANISKKTRQTSSVLEVRNRVVAITKDSDKFLDKLRALPTTGTTAGFNACLPPKGTIVNSFVCPQVKSGLIDSSSNIYDSELHRLSVDGVYKVTDTQLVDAAGDKIAGTLEAPHYMSDNGASCSATNFGENCPLRSTGFFFRTNGSVNADPGSVKFVVKIENNPKYLRGPATTPMKAQYMTADLGTQWNVASSSCVLPSLQVGVQPDGSAMCLAPISCGANSLLTGLEVDGSPRCKVLPSCTSATANKITLNASGDLVCSSASPCPSGEAHLGYYAGTGSPICSAPRVCQPNHILMGSNCKPVQNCDPNSQIMTYSNGSFSCMAKGVPTLCPTGQYLVEIRSNGTADCRAGIPGATGAAGRDGTAGAAGAAGRDGARGVAGANGATGATGAAGKDANSVKQFNLWAQTMVFYTKDCRDGTNKVWTPIFVPANIPLDANAVLVETTCAENYMFFRRANEDYNLNFLAANNLEMKFLNLRDSDIKHGLCFSGNNEMNSKTTLIYLNENRYFEVYNHGKNCDTRAAYINVLGYQTP